jgi:hypothetical protein
MRDAGGGATERKDAEQSFIASSSALHRSQRLVQLHLNVNFNRNPTNQLKQTANDKARRHDSSRNTYSGE